MTCWGSRWARGRNTSCAAHWPYMIFLRIEGCPWRPRAGVVEISTQLYIQREKGLEVKVKVLRVYVFSAGVICGDLVQLAGMLLGGP